MIFVNNSFTKTTRGTIDFCSGAFEVALFRCFSCSYQRQNKNTFCDIWPEHMWPCCNPIFTNKMNVQNTWFFPSKRHETLSFARESKQYMFNISPNMRNLQTRSSTTPPQYNLIYLPESGRSRDQPLQGSPSRRGCGGPCLRGCLVPFHIGMDLSKPTINMFPKYSYFINHVKTWSRHVGDNCFEKWPI
jgi:hypothetical protein